MRVEETCAICDQPASEHHFGIRSCRACAAFMRRTCANNRAYKCHRSNNCDVSVNRDSTRAACKACPLAKCLRQGMRPDLVQSAHHSLRRQLRQSSLSDSSGNTRESKGTSKQSDVHVKDPRVVSVASFYEQKSRPENTRVVALLAPKTTSVDQMTRGMHDYCRQQRSLFRLLYPERDPDKLYFVHYDECEQMNAASISVTFNVLTDFFAGFSELDLKFKASVTSSFFDAFSYFFQTYREHCCSSRKGDLSHFVLHCGQVVDCCRMDVFYRNDPDPIASVKQSADAGDLFRMLKRQLRLLDVRDEEVAALIGIKLWDEIAFSSVDYCKLAAEQKDRIYRELHADIAACYHTPEAGPRVGQLLMLLCQVDAIVTSMRNSETAARLFGLHGN
ncbi:hypothetical protein M3Y99_01016200 [Aphelenchoides fujianensis]|nr:hypothetical protein M3Y99_01016200 [Aphelenchoides fujianensis]